MSSICSIFPRHLSEVIEKVKKQMERASKNLNFDEAIKKFTIFWFIILCFYVKIALQLNIVIK